MPHYRCLTGFLIRHWTEHHSMRARVRMDLFLVHEWKYVGQIKPRFHEYFTLGFSRNKLNLRGSNNNLRGENILGKSIFSNSNSNGDIWMKFVNKFFCFTTIIRFIIHSVSNYLFKVNNRSTRTRCGICPVFHIEQVNADWA